VGNQPRVWDLKDVEFFSTIRPLMQQHAEAYPVPFIAPATSAILLVSANELPFER